MAILNINDLTEIQSSALTDNDMLVVGTQAGAKKIKANSLGGGGSDDFVINFTNNNGTITADKTVSQLYTAYTGGKNIIGKMVMVPEEGMTMYADYYFGAMSYSEQGIGVGMYGITGAEGGSFLTGIFDGTSDTWTESNFTF